MITIMNDHLYNKTIVTLLPILNVFGQFALNKSQSPFMKGVFSDLISFTT